MNINTDTTAFLHQVLHIDMVDFLSAIGHRPSGEKAGIVTFPSPFLGKGPLEVDTRLNTFNDHSLEISQGNLLTFGQVYYHCRIPKLLNIIREIYPFKNEETRHPDQVYLEKGNYKDDISIINVDEHLLLADHNEVLKKMNIPLDISRPLIQGIDFLHRGFEKQGIAFFNDSGGCVINDGTTFLKYGSQAPTFIDNGAKQVDVFEHFGDMLAHRNLHSKLPVNPNNVLVLNSIYDFENARKIMESHQQVNLYLQHSPISREYTGYSQWLNKNLYKDFSLFYKKINSLSAYNQETKRYLGRQIKL